MFGLNVLERYCRFLPRRGTIRGGSITYILATVLGPLLGSVEGAGRTKTQLPGSSVPFSVVVIA